MDEWKIRQHIYHKTHEIQDDITDKPVVLIPDDQIVRYAVDYFVAQSETLVYPAKSYAVAIVYALLLHKYFGVDVRVALADPLLLYGNDKFFVPYNQNAKAYDDIMLALARLELLDIEATSVPQVAETVSYFMSEFMLSS